MSSETWHGTLRLARDFALLHGGAGPTTRHAHYAHQLLLSGQAPVTVEIEGERIRSTCVLIESMREHAIIHAPSQLYVLYAEPLAFAAATLRDLDAAWSSPESLANAVRALPRRELSDIRVASALAEIDALLDDKIHADTIAARVQLSLSQLERLFSAHVGLSLRRLVRWRRLRLALSLAIGGALLTQAAHGAGFADSAHFSRVMREMFGVRADHALADLRVQLLD